MSDRDFTRAVLATLLVLLACTTLFAQQKSPAPAGEIIGQRIVFVDGTTLDVDDAWKQGDTIWYRLRGTSQSTTRAVRTIETRYKEQPTAAKPPALAAATPAPAKTVEIKAVATPTWIYLVDGARLRVDEVREVADGAWYNR